MLHFGELTNILLIKKDDLSLKYVLIKIVGISGNHRKIH